MADDLDTEAGKATDLLLGSAVEGVFRDNEYEVIVSFSNGLELLAYSTANGELALSIAPTAEHRRQKT